MKEKLLPFKHCELLFTTNDAVGLVCRLIVFVILSEQVPLLILKVIV